VKARGWWLVPVIVGALWVAAIVAGIGGWFGLLAIFESIG
jgi:hypothetical protein